MITTTGTSLRVPLGNLLLAVWILLLLCLGTVFAQERTPAGKAVGEASKKKLIGVWESPDTTKGGLGAIYEFREDGGLMVGMGALVNMTYDPQDPNLQQLLPNDKTPDADDRPQKIIEGPLGSASYVGVWKFRHYTGGFAYQQITADGRILLRIPFPTPWGKYEIKGKKLRIIQQGCPPVDVVYKVTEKTLDLTAPGKKTQRLIRVIPTWYHALTESETEEAKIRLQQIVKENKQEKQNEGDVSEYLCWGLGVIVKTNERTTIVKISDGGYSSARGDLKPGDEIIKVGQIDIDKDNAQAILTKPLVRENDGRVPVVIRRDGEELSFRIKPNLF